MAIDIDTEIRTDVPAPPTPSNERPRRRPAWVSQHLGTAIVLAVAGYALGHFVGNTIASGYANIAGPLPAGSATQ